MDSGTSDWWRRHGWTLGLLLVAFGFAFALRTIWQYPVIQQFGALYTYAGGSDSYYHSRVMTYIIQTHRNLVYDPMLKFPVGSINPREPLFDWMNAVLGILFAPFFGGNANNAGAWFLDFQSPFWAALTVFPLYLIGREVSGRRAGLIAALVYPFFSASIDSSTFGYADYLSFYTFFLLVVVYSFLRTLKAVGHRRWVESYRDRSQYLPAIRGFLRTETTAVKWAVFTGVALGAFALAWQGYTYAIIVIAFTALVAMLIERVRHVDSFGLYVALWIVGLIAIPMAAPYYLVQGDFRLFLELPVILYFGALVLLLPFLLLRDVPWVFSIPALVAVVGVGVVALKFLDPPLFASAVTGNGYFVKTLVYSTVAEAQAPSIDALIVNYGVVTFFLAFAGLALVLYQLVRQRFKRYHIAFLIFAVVSVYLPISAAKFFLVSSPGFALLAAEGIHRLLDVGGYPQLRRSVASLTDRTGRFSAFRKSFKARHVLVLALAIGILLPNVWIAIDAGIPSNTKNHVAAQINATLPSWLKLNQSAPGSNYLGAAGSGLDTSNQYDSAAYNWLATQDANVPEPNRPAFVSWWDYGFQAIDQGQHPSVADNFQNGIDPAGQLLLSQNESLAIAILATTLLQGELQATHHTTLPSSLNAILARDGVDVTYLHQLLTNEAADYTNVVRSPGVYLPVNPATLTLDNAMYLATSYYLAGHLTLAGVAQVYGDLQTYTGWSIRYAMTDSRLFPFSGQDTGIFYAPADLTGRVINSAGLPTTFFTVAVLGSDGNTYPYGPLPSGVTAVQYSINYTSAFYNSMIYHIYIGYNGTQAGEAGGIPGLTGAAQGDPIEPGWMLQHFEVAYQTGYVCAGVPQVPAGSPCMVATNRPTAEAIANKTNGTSDLSAISYFQGGESILEYYPGETLDGRLVLPSGQPVGGVRVTVDDGEGIPHMTTVTGASGAFTLVLPPGNDTLKLSYGTVTPRLQTGVNVLSTIPLTVPAGVGFDPNAPPLLQAFTLGSAAVSGLVYWNTTGNATFSPAEPVVRGAQVNLTSTTGGANLSVTTDASGAFQLPQVAPGAYNLSVRYQNRSFSPGNASVNLSAGATVALPIGLQPGQLHGTVTISGGGVYAGATVTLAGPNGFVTTSTTGDRGTYSFTGLSPGSYTIGAVGLDPSLRSAQVPVTLASEGSNLTANLTLEVGGTAEVLVQASGTALAGASVAFTPFASLAGASTAPLAALWAASTNATFAVASAQGLAAATLPVGVYTVNAYARVLGALYTGAATLNVTGPGATPTVTLNLSPARAVTVSLPLASDSSVKTAVLAYAANGAQLTGWAAKNGTVLLPLASGPYTLLGLQGAATSGANATVGLSALTVTGATSLTLGLTPAVPVHLKVGTPGVTGGVLAAANATVVLSAGPGGPRLTAISDGSGGVGFAIPSVPPGSAGGYCLAASAFGFAPASVCGLASADLRAMTTLNLTAVPVPVTLTVQGLPSGTSVTVNITGESVATHNLTFTGGPSFAFTLTPGIYGVGARAVIGHGSTIYLPSAVLSTTIPLGAASSRLTLVVVPEINASGKLVLPSGLEPAQVTVALASPLVNVTVNGTAYTTLFRATPATYTATVTGVAGALTYVNVSRVTLSANGTITPKLVLSQLGEKVNGSLLERPGAALATNATVTLVTPTGLAIVEHAVAGSFKATLLAGTYRAFANATVATPGPNGTYFTNWTTGPSAGCSFPSATPVCNVFLNGTIVLDRVTGTLVGPGGSGVVPGTVRLIGPYPSTNVTVVSASNGSFATSLVPGAYYVYAASTSGPAVASLGRLLALPTAPVAVTIPLQATWTTAVRLSAINGTSVPAGAGTVTVRDLFGDSATFPNVSLGPPLELPLPPGTYTVSAAAPGTLNGVAGTATSTARLALVAGNAVLDLGLAVPPTPKVTAALSGTTHATVSAGGQATFAFSVTASGNVPVTVHPVGSPASWGFAFSFANATLAPGASLSAEVRITVPNGTAVDHTGLQIVLQLPNGTQAGQVTPAPKVDVVPYYGIVGGLIASSPPQVGPTHAQLPFYVVDSGNTAESVRLSVVDSARLASYGWTFGWLVSNAKLPSGNLPFTAGENRSLALNLSATSTYAVDPGEVTVLASVVNVTGTFAATIVLPFPHPTVATSPGTFTVTGPSVQGGPSGAPAWLAPLLAFLPTLALIAGVVTYRWRRTRRWTRR